MRTVFLLFFCSLVCHAKHVALDFQDITDFYQGSSQDLGDFYNGGPGGNLGIRGLGGFIDPFVVEGVLLFPLHGPSRIFVEGGFQGSISFRYSFSGALYSYHGIVLYHEGQPIAYFQLPAANFDTISTFEFYGVADEIGFGLTPQEDFTGNAGDVKYQSIEFSNLHLPVPPYPTPEPAPSITVRRPGPTQFKRVQPTPKGRGIR
jgi:hypothetical protein